jgi:hypothetical protein
MATSEVSRPFSSRRLVTPWKLRPWQHGVEPHTSENLQAPPLNEVATDVRIEPGKRFMAHATTGANLPFCKSLNESCSSRVTSPRSTPSSSSTGTAWLFRAQFALHEHGYTSHEGLLAAWLAAIRESTDAQPPSRLPRPHAPTTWRAGRWRSSPPRRRSASWPKRQLRTGLDAHCLRPGILRD